MFDLSSPEFGLEQAREAWRVVLDQVQLQLTQATFDTLLRGSEVMDYEDGLFTVGVKGEHARDWLENRLVDMLARALGELCGGVVSVSFVVDRLSTAIYNVDRETAVTNNYTFPGFEPMRTNFVQTPKQYFEHVIPAGPPVLAAFVGAVIAQTVGVIVNFHTSERREWWEASYSEIGRVCGIKSKASVGKAVRLARKLGYVVRGEGQFDYQYRLRRMGEDVDRIKK